MREAPELLRIEAARDFLIGLPRRNEWQFLGRFYAAKQLMKGCAQTPCDVYGLLSPEAKSQAPRAVPEKIDQLNTRFFTAECRGLTDRRICWEIADGVPGLKWPMLWQVCRRDWFRRFLGWTERSWWDHPGRRQFERVVIVPLVEDES